MKLTPALIGFLAASVLVSAELSSLTIDNLSNNFESYKVWCQYHGKDEGDSSRFAVWQNNFELVEQHNAKHNAGLSTFYLSMKTKYADLTNKEYQSLLLKTKS